jgi:hypothetical protein
MASRTALSPRLRGPARAARWLLVALTLGGIATAAAGLLRAGSAATPAGVLIAGVGAVSLILLVALEFDFDQRGDRPADHRGLG